MNATKISIRLDELKAIVKAAEARHRDGKNGCSDILLIKKARYHGQNAEVDVFAQSAWPECDSKYIYTTKES
jgi:hypothetical protein